MSSTLQGRRLPELNPPTVEGLEMVLKMQGADMSPEMRAGIRRQIAALKLKSWPMPDGKIKNTRSKRRRIDLSLLPDCPEREKGLLLDTHLLTDKELDAASVLVVPSDSPKSTK